MTVRDELFALIGEAREQRLKEATQRRMMLDLLRGNYLFLGDHQVEIAFPDGQPLGKSNAELADLFDVEAPGEYIPPKHLKNADVALQPGWVQWRGGEARA